MKSTEAVRTVRYLATGILLLYGVMPGARDVMSTAVAARIVVSRQVETGTTTVIVPSVGGRLAGDDILHGLAQAAQLDVRELTEPIPWRSVDLERQSTRLAIRVISAAMPDVRLRIKPYPQGDDPALWIRLDRGDSREKVRRLKAALREKLGDSSADYGLKLPEDWQKISAERPLVVLVHGYNASPQSLAGLQKLVIQRGWPCATFLYPNDGPLADSGALLARELRHFRNAHPERAVVLVAHSMGGLVARVAIEDADLDPGNVASLIMVCTPNGGTQWAQLPGGLECWEHLRSGRDSGLQSFRASMADGLNEARSDLKPESIFLRQLNSANRNPQVRYSLLLGTASPLSRQASQELKHQVLQSLEAHTSGRVVLPRVASFLDGLDELQSGSGDGVVSVERGRLEGVDDVVLLPVHHCAITGTSPKTIPACLRDAILERIVRQ